MHRCSAHTTSSCCQCSIVGASAAAEQRATLSERAGDRDGEHGSSSRKSHLSAAPLFLPSFPRSLAALPLAPAAPWLGKAITMLITSPGPRRTSCQVRRYAGTQVGSGNSRARGQWEEEEDNGSGAGCAGKRD